MSSLWNTTKSYADGIRIAVRNPNVLPLAMLIWMHQRYRGK